MLSRHAAPKKQTTQSISKRKICTQDRNNSALDTTQYFAKKLICMTSLSNYYSIKIHPHYFCNDCKANKLQSLEQRLNAIIIRLNKRKKK